MKIVLPVNNCREKILEAHFGRAGYYLVVIVENNEVVSEECIVNPRMNGARPGDYFAELGVDAVIIPRSGGIGSKALVKLRGRGVKVFIVDASNADDAIKSFISGRVEEYIGEGCSGGRT